MISPTFEILPGFFVDPGNDDKDDDVARYLLRAGDTPATIEDDRTESANDPSSSKLLLLLLLLLSLETSFISTVSAPNFAVSVRNAESAMEEQSSAISRANGKSMSASPSLSNRTPWNRLVFHMGI